MPERDVEPPSISDDPSQFLTPNRIAYEARCRAVYDHGEPACGARGPHKAKCVLPPNHDGDLHEGNGFDTFGPKYECWRD